MNLLVGKRGKVLARFEYLCRLKSILCLMGKMEFPIEKRMPATMAAHKAQGLQTDEFGETTTAAQRAEAGARL